MDGICIIFTGDVKFCDRENGFVTALVVVAAAATSSFGQCPFQNSPKFGITFISYVKGKTNTRNSYIPSNHLPSFYLLSRLLFKMGISFRNMATTICQSEEFVL